jgi:hypothetical protein
MGLMGRIGLEGDTSLYHCKEDPDDLELKLFKTMRPHMEKRAENKFSMFKVIFYKIAEGVASRTYLVKIQVNKKEFVHAAIRRKERPEVR